MKTIKSNAGRRKKIIKIKAEITKIMKKKQLKSINKTQNLFFNQ